MAGSDPPAALQTLLGLRTDFSYEPSAEQCKQLIGRQVMLRSGGETEVLATPLIEQCRIRLPDVDDPEAPFQVREYQAAHGLLRLTVHHVQQGWVRIDFVPELHHGNERLRHEASDTGWQFTNRQLVDPLYSQRFSLTLAVGEMVLLTGDRAIVTGETPVDTQPLGELLFHSSDQKSAIQRMLVIRASDLSKDADLYANLKPSGS